MNASALFTIAHMMTRESVNRFGGDYRVTFAAALRIAYQESKKMSTHPLRQIVTTTLTDEQLEKSAAYFTRVTGKEPSEMPAEFRDHIANKERHMAPAPKFDARMYGVPSGAYMNDRNEQNEPA